MKCDPPLISRPTMPPFHPTGVTPTVSPLISRVRRDVMLPLSCHRHDVKYAPLSSHGRDATSFCPSYPTGVVPNVPSSHPMAVMWYRTPPSSHQCDAHDVCLI